MGIPSLACRNNGMALGSRSDFNRDLYDSYVVATQWGVVHIRPGGDTGGDDIGVGVGGAGRAGL